MGCDCDWCRRDADIDAWKARAEKAEADRAVAREGQDVLADEVLKTQSRVRAAESRATQAEARALLMRDALLVVEHDVLTGERLDDVQDAVRIISDSVLGEAPRKADAGRTLLAELEALREVARIAAEGVRRAFRCTHCESAPVRMTMALAAVDAARKGE